MATSSEADLIQTETDRLRSDVRPVSPSFLRALGLMKITSEKTTVTSVPLSKSRATDTDKNAGGSHTSANKELIRPLKKQSLSKRVAASSTAKKTRVGKKKHVSKPKDRAEKRSHAESFHEPQSISGVVSVKKVRKHAAPATGKPKKQQASPPAMTAEDLSEFTSAADELRLWRDSSQSDLISLIKNGQFTEAQAQLVEESFQYLSQKFRHRSIKLERCMKTHECIDCNFSISHECPSIDIRESWNFSGNGLRVDFITPESITMCRCTFTFFHSHITKPISKPQARSLESSPLPNTSLWLEDHRSVSYDCPRCYMGMIMTNQNKDVCSDLMAFVSTKCLIRRKMYIHVKNNLDDLSENDPAMNEFLSCKNGCCMIFHRCAADVLVGNTVPSYRPLLFPEPKDEMIST